jgi:hypothetical protein
VKTLDSLHKINNRKEKQMSRTVELKGLDMFIYFIEHFKMTPEEALQEMKDHSQDVKDAKLLIKLANDKGIKQKGLLDNFYKEHPIVEKAFNNNQEGKANDSKTRNE